MSDEIKASPDPIAAASTSAEPLAVRDGIQNNGPVAPQRIAPVAPKAAPTPTAKPPAPESKDGFREVVETVVFVIVLVLMLKSFVAEAFVIPTGSMATTLYGYHRQVKCPQCDFSFPVNISKQSDDAPWHNDQNRPEVTHCTCPNCQLRIYIGSARPEGDQP